MTTTAIDWSSKPEPWCWIGPQFRRQCEAIGAPTGNARPFREPTISEQLRRRKRELGIGRKTLAAATGLSLASISKALNDGATASVLKRVLAALDRIEAQRCREAT